MHFVNFMLISLYTFFVPTELSPYILSTECCTSMDGIGIEKVCGDGWEANEIYWTDRDGSNFCSPAPVSRLYAQWSLGAG